MSLLPFGDLPVHTPRRFVPERLDLGHWPSVQPLFDQLDARVAGCGTVALFEQWILDCGELAA
ncbi:MAG: M3 family oligoendopeptidase, partial [Verrucomicrobia bacterium]|nr:M3 family oligoendopeptidase [Verrucomicrobiota bacterium]